MSQGIKFRKEGAGQQNPMTKEKMEKKPGELWNFFILMTTREGAKNRVKFDEVEFKFQFMSCMFTTPHWPGSVVPLYKNGNTIGEKHANKVNHHGEGESN